MFTYVKVYYNLRLWVTLSVYLKIVLKAMVTKKHYDYSKIRHKQLLIKSL